jgi:hypothetical protein
MSGGKRGIHVTTRLYYPEALPPGMRDIRRLPVREDAARNWLKKTRVHNNPYAVEVITAIRSLTMQRTQRHRPRVEEPYHTYHDSDPTHYSQAYEFGVVHKEWRGAGPSQAAEQPRLYANPHGTQRDVPVVGTVPTIRR